MGQKWPKNAMFSQKMCVLILTGPHVTKFGQNGNKMKFLSIALTDTGIQVQAGH